MPGREDIEWVQIKQWIDIPNGSEKEAIEELLKQDKPPNLKIGLYYSGEEEPEHPTKYNLEENDLADGATLLKFLQDAVENYNKNPDDPGVWLSAAAMKHYEKELGASEEQDASPSAERVDEEPAEQPKKEVPEEEIEEAAALKPLIFEEVALNELLERIPEDYPNRTEIVEEIEDNTRNDIFVGIVYRGDPGIPPDEFSQEILTDNFNEDGGLLGFLKKNSENLKSDPPGTVIWSSGFEPAAEAVVAEFNATAKRVEGIIDKIEEPLPELIEKNLRSVGVATDRFSDFVTNQDNDGIPTQIDFDKMPEIQDMQEKMNKWAKGWEEWFETHTKITDDMDLSDLPEPYDGPEKVEEAVQPKRVEISWNNLKTIIPDGEKYKQILKQWDNWQEKDDSVMVQFLLKDPSLLSDSSKKLTEQVFEKILSENFPGKTLKQISKKFEIWSFLQDKIFQTDAVVAAGPVAEVPAQPPPELSQIKTAEKKAAKDKPAHIVEISWNELRDKIPDDLKDKKELEEILKEDKNIVFQFKLDTPTLPPGKLSKEIFLENFPVGGISPLSFIKAKGLKNHVDKQIKIPTPAAAAYLEAEKEAALAKTPAGTAIKAADTKKMADSGFLGGFLDTAKAGSPASYTEFHKQAAKSLVELAGEKRLGTVGKPMSHSKFKEITEKWDAKFSEEGRQKWSEEEQVKYHNVDCSRNSKDGSSQTTVALENGNVQTITHSYEPEKTCPKVTMSNPPDDQTIFLFMESSMNMAPLTLSTACGQEVALKLFEASVISGTDIVLSREDQNLLKDNDRYNKLLEIRGDKEQLKEFREKVAGAGDAYKLGQTELGEKLVFHATAPKTPKT